MNTKEHYPQIEQFEIGQSRDDDDRTLVGILKVSGGLDGDPSGPGNRTGPVFGLIENYGPNAFTFSVKQSSDNDITDAWAPISMRIDGATVATVLVAPKGKVVFVMETITEDYVRFETDVEDTWGRLSTAAYGGQMERREREKVK